MFYIPFVLILPVSVYGIGQSHYECGENGRFEYCIDGIPGCIVGCHCHPGYYFDTDSKICEPNAKLVQEYRRLYSGMEPTRVPNIILPMNEVDLAPTPTTTSTLDAQVENTAKESDDLGDWLYNQFFKTIETQVINSTDENEKPETRRSNHEPSSKKKPKRQKKSKSESKKGKKKDLRRKLLRITEDDSLFESSSSSSDDSSDDSGSSSDSSSDTSSDGDYPPKNDGKKHDHDDKEHGHRKILFINKKPKPPLPSFIFLPQMETPFFAPIGLAPPPMPMYPMVPVPPMPMPPMYPMPPPPVTPPCANNSSESSSMTKAPDDNKTTTTEAIVTSTPKNTTDNSLRLSGPGSLVTELPWSEQPLPNIEVNIKIITMVLNLFIVTIYIIYLANESGRNSLRTKSRAKANMNDRYLYRSEGTKRGQRKKLLRELQQMKSLQMRKKAQREPDSENFDNPFVEERFRASPDTMPPPPPRDDRPQENVDFKYLAQLIHKMDNNNKTSITKPNETHEPKVPMRRYGGDQIDNYYHPPAEDSFNNARRSFLNNRHLETPDESYYANLGHQIASLIRKIDATGEQRVNIEIERQKASQPVYDFKPQSFEQTPFIMENSYTPRSYWERSVRSLLKRIQPYDEYYPRKIREESLFNLERKVETLATTTRSLSLNDLENVVFLIDRATSKLQRSTETPETTTIINDDSLNINLLPHTYERSRNEQKSYEYGLKRALPNQLNQINNMPVAQKAVNDSEVLKRFINGNKQQTSLRGVLLHNFQPVPSVDLKNIFNTKKVLNKFDLKNLPAFGLKNLAKLSKNLIKIPGHSPKRKIYRNITFNQHDIANLQRLVGAKLNQVNNKRNKLPNVPWLGPKLANMLSNPENYRKHARQPLKMKLIPRKHNYQSNKMYVDNNNRYLHHKESMLMPLSAPARRSSPPAAPAPSAYFHHEVQHFDVFEESN